MAKKYAETETKKAEFAPAAEICLKYGNKADALLEILHDLQAELGHVPQEALPVIAEQLNLSRAEVYGVVTFYHDYHQKPTGKHVIKICRAEACQSAGGFAVISALEKALNVKLGETSADGKFTLEAVYCLGLCPMGPAALIKNIDVFRCELSRLVQRLGGLLYFPRGKDDPASQALGGVPYGASTEGARFLPPAKVQPWTGVRDALELAPASPQNPSNLIPESMAQQPKADWVGTEDCLHLNLWSHLRARWLR